VVAEKVCPRSFFAEIPALKVHIAGRNTPEFLKEQLTHIPNVVFHGEIEDASTFMQSYKAIIVPLFTGSGIRVKIMMP
jgi:glycosyltransferase involved in cell wall biosynthesis